MSDCTKPVNAVRVAGEDTLGTWMSDNGCDDDTISLRAR
jgi:hypothetical protein